MMDGENEKIKNKIYELERSRLNCNADVMVGGQRLDDETSSGKYNNNKNTKSYITMNDDAFSGKNMFNMQGHRDNASQSH